MKKKFIKLSGLSPELREALTGQMSHEEWEAFRDGLSPEQWLAIGRELKRVSKLPRYARLAGLSKEEAEAALKADPIEFN